MSEEQDFDLFYAKERTRQAEAAHKAKEEALNRTKARATSLLGWAITLTTASVGAAMQGECKSAASVAAFGFFATSVLCAKVLYSTKTQTLLQPPARFDGIMREGDEKTELGFYRAFSEFAEDVDTANDTAITKDQKTMRLAWIVGCATPAAAALFAFGAWLIGCGRSA